MKTNLSAQDIQKIIETTWQAVGSEPQILQSAEVKEAIFSAMQNLDSGTWQVIEKIQANSTNEYVLHEWLKKAILLYFRVSSLFAIHAGDLSFYDKVPVKKWNGSEGVRVVPQALVRFGSFVEKGAILMPSFVNIGAYVETGTMVDTWATVGSCARIGSHVHLSGGVGIGGVLEPVQARPVIIEDHVFVGSRCIVVEGVHVEQGAVLGAGVTLTGSTKIIDVTTAEAKTYQGRVPKNSVVIPGTLPKQFPAGVFQVPCALIIGQRKESTNQKTSLTDALREFNVPV